MALRKTPAQRKPRTASASLKSVQTNDTTVNIATSAKTAEKVIVLFASRVSQRFNLPSGKVVLLAGNAVHLHGKRDGVLPQGGYSVNIVDKDAWDEVKKLYGRAYKPWFDTGKIIERNGMSEDAAVNLAADNAGDDSDFNPVDPKTRKTKPVDDPL